MTLPGCLHFVDFGAAQKKSARVRAVQASPGILIRRHGFNQAIRDGAPELGWWWGGVEQPVSQLRPDRRPSDGCRYINLEGNAKGVDVNPVFLKRFKRTGHRSVTWFCLEGTFKSDAALSVGWQSINVPSVTLWDSGDLLTVGSVMKKSPLTFVMTDSDWATNPMVWNQALKCVEKLKLWGIPAVHVAPRPLEHLAKTGLDDIIASPTWAPLEDIVVVPGLCGAPAKCSPSARVVYQWLLAQRRVEVVAYPKTIMDALEMPKSTLRGATELLEKLDLVEVQHGERFRNSETGAWDANPNTYRLRPQEPKCLAELGWEVEHLEAAVGRKAKGWQSALQKLASATLRASNSPAPLACDRCGAPIIARRSTKRYCSSSCRVAAMRAARGRT